MPLSQKPAPPQTAIPSYTYHSLVISAGPATSALFEVNCPPVIANGYAQCYVQDVNMSPPSMTAGANCGGWTNFALTRR